MTSLTQHSAAPVRMERLALPATDGYPLSAYRYHAPGHAHGNLLVAGAT
ncbi:alpha/beta hydrolase, partial [Pseudomonas aeruginosa]|nr:alpha/beta hydrolase [Pseudomonas aeruginosa]